MIVIHRLSFVVGMLAVAAGLAAQTPSWRDAVPGRSLVLPDDHASHPDYKLEWWYYTGNLRSADARRFGYQLTFFRIGVHPAPQNPSRWTVRDLFMAHFALTDANGRRFRFADRINRSAPGWAGAATDVYRVWNDDWQARRDSGSLHRLSASTKEFGIDLQLGENRPPVLHGEHGYSRKGASSGNASFYYSLTRMPTEGTVMMDGRRIEVTGQSWMDHEFGTTFLEPQQVGWDWFSVQLDDGRDLMVFQLRRRDGSIDPHSSGTLVEPDGSVRHVALDGGFRLEPGRVWASPVSGGRYPVEWRVRIPGEDIDLAVRPVLDDQELRTRQSADITYWEGAIDVDGRSKARPVQGRGYLEMTGYAGRGLEGLR